MTGCTYEELVVHLNTNDRGFVYGDPDTVLHIDHIRPKANFNLLCRVEQFKCANWNNLQLLPGSENIVKRDSFTAAESEAYDKSVGGMAIMELEKGWRASGVCTCELCV